VWGTEEVYLEGAAGFEPAIHAGSQKIGFRSAQASARKGLLERFPACAYCACGNLALVSQKSLMLFTRFSNALNCTGLQR
jgi:hypothetical protein